MRPSLGGEREDREQCQGEGGADDCSSRVKVWFEGVTFGLRFFCGEKVVFF